MWYTIFKCIVLIILWTQYYRPLVTLIKVSVFSFCCTSAYPGLMVSNCFCSYISGPLDFYLLLFLTGSREPGKSATRNRQEIVGRGDRRIDQVSLRRQNYESESADFEDKSVPFRSLVKMELGLFWSILSYRISNGSEVHLLFLFWAFAWKEREEPWNISWWYAGEKCNGRGASISSGEEGSRNETIL